MEDQKRIDELYGKAIDAMRRYASYKTDKKPT